MSEAAKVCPLSPRHFPLDGITADIQLFDKSGGAAQGGKQDAINGAAGTIVKLMLKSQMTGVSPSYSQDGIDADG